jgi:hypothetical protein
MRIFMIESNVNPAKASLMMKTVSALLFIKIVGLLLPCFDLTKYLDSWLLQKSNSAISINSRKLSQDIASDENFMKMWNFL